MKFALTTATVASVLAFACAPPNPQKMAPPEVYGQGVQSAPIASKISFTPKVDILFVVDNSDSMEKHQENFRRNIDRFVSAFEADKRLDFHIGVTSIFDSRRYGPVVKNFWPIGKLYPVQDGTRPPVLAGQLPPMDASIGTGFITRVANYPQILGNTLKIGVIPRGTSKVDLGGPEFEELFSPVMPAVDGRNVGFIRPDAHLAIIMITDADDVSSVSPSKLAADLTNLKGNDSSMISTYAVISLSKSCPKDPGNDPRKMPAGFVPNQQILEFLKDTQGHAYDLCDPQYGAKLAEAGRLIAKNAEQDVKIPLEQIPQDGTLRVTLSGTNQDVPYQYDPYSYTITIPSSAMDGQPVDAQLDITYTPVDIRRLGTNRTKTSSL